MARISSKSHCLRISKTIHCGFGAATVVASFTFLMACGVTSGDEPAVQQMQGNQLPAMSPEGSAGGAAMEVAPDDQQTSGGVTEPSTADTESSEEPVDELLELDNNGAGTDEIDSTDDTSGNELDPAGETEEPSVDELAPNEEELEFSPCPTDGSACRIMPLGDSITDGIDLNIGYSSNGGYRLELFRQAINAGHEITFVGTRPPNGPMTETDSGQAFPRDHEGISGDTIAQVAGRVEAALVANPPHIVLLQIGTNNLYEGMAANLPGQLESLVDQITVGAPDALIVVAQITPLGESFPNNGVAQYNAAIPAMVQTHAEAGAHIMMVNMFDPIANRPNFVAQLLPDNIHPNAEGYALMGDVWFEGIEAFLP